MMWDTDSAWRWVPPSTNTLEWATRNSVDPGNTNDNVGWLWSTLILRKLLTNESYRNDFINRFSDLMNTVLLPSQVLAHIDTLASMIRSEIPREIARWKEESPENIWDAAQWEQNVEYMRQFVRQRPHYQREHIMEKFGIADTTRVTLLSPIGQGKVRINTLTPEDLPWSGVYFQGIPVSLCAVPDPGWTFYQWSDTTLPDQPEIEVILEGDRTIQAVFYKSLELQEISVESITDSTATVTWGTNVAAIGHIDYGPTESLGQSTEEEIEETEAHEIILRGLDSDTQYYFQIVCTSSLGEHNQSGIETFRTLGGSTSVWPMKEGLPEQFELSPNYPNPFNSSTCIAVSLPEPGNLRAAIYNVSGQEVYRVYDGGHSAGIIRMVWDGTNSAGEDLVSGVYILRIIFEGKSGKRDLAMARLVMIR